MSTRKTFVFNTILVHVSRTWERIRMAQPNEEMSADNIESVDFIVGVADEIFGSDVILRFIDSEDGNWDWNEETGEDFSDTFIESEAERIILRDFNS